MHASFLQNFPTEKIEKTETREEVTGNLSQASFTPQWSMGITSDKRSARDQLSPQGSLLLLLIGNS